MPSKLKFTLTCGDYEIVRPLKEDDRPFAKQEGFEIEVRTAISRLQASRDRVSPEDRNIPQSP
jgi:hypothetical protein